MRFSGEKKENRHFLFSTGNERLPVWFSCDCQVRGVSQALLHTKCQASDWPTHQRSCGLRVAAVGLSAANIEIISTSSNEALKENLGKLAVLEQLAIVYNQTPDPQERIRLVEEYAPQLGPPFSLKDLLFVYADTLSIFLSVALKWYKRKGRAQQKIRWLSKDLEDFLARSVGAPKRNIDRTVLAIESDITTARSDYREAKRAYTDMMKFVSEVSRFAETLMNTIEAQRYNMMLLKHKEHVSREIDDAKHYFPEWLRSVKHVLYVENEEHERVQSRRRVVAAKLEFQANT